MASRRFTVDSAKKKEFINIFLLMPESSVINAMRQATFTDENIADLPLRRSLQRALPGGSIKGLKDYIARQRKQPPPHLPVDPAASTDAAATVPPAEEVVIDAHLPIDPAATDAAATVPPEATTVLSSLSPGTATKRKYDRKRWNCIYYKKKKVKMTTTTQMTTMQTTTTTQTTTKTTTTQTTTTMTAVCLDEHWTLNANGTMRTPLAQRIAKCRQVKPAVDIILRAGNAVRQGALLRGVLDHPSMFSARKMAAIDSSKESAAEKYVVGQSARMMERNRNTSKLHGNTTTEKRDAVEVILAFSAPSPQKTTSVPSRRDRARALGVPSSTLARVDARLIEKRRQLTTAGETGVHWALSKRKKGFSKIDEALRLLLVDAFNDHPHVIVSPNSKDTLQHKNADGEIVLVRKVLTQVSLGSIFSDIVREHPTIKNRVGERAFRYIISRLGCVRRFTVGTPSLI